MSSGDFPEINVVDAGTTLAVVLRIGASPIPADPDEGS
jgi:hypothetical protein